jgi:hypothetical protein
VTSSAPRWYPGLIALAVFAAGCGAAAAAGHGGDPATRVRPRPRAQPAAVIHTARSTTIHFGRARETRSFRLHEPAGVILLYRLRAPAGVRVRGTTQLPRLTVPLEIRTAPVGPSSACADRASKLICTVGEEWCPMPRGTWRVRLQKLAGPAGDVTLWFHVGTPPGRPPA